MSSTRPWGRTGAKARLVDARDEEVLVGVLDPEQLVANGAADDVCVEAERADVLANRGGHGADSAGADHRAAPGGRACAIASISTSAPEGSFATSTVERAGGRSPTCRAYTSFIAAKSSRSLQEDRGLHEPVEAAAGRLEDRREVAHHLLGLGGDVALDRGVAGLQPSWPATKTKSPARIAWLYGAPWNGAGAASVRITVFSISSQLLSAAAKRAARAT